ncbi:MAG: SLBB domain-containing protein, partial [Clostridia bacterium]|nr:SLBB domain-containing protein [Clostridia bacterium]
MDIVACALNAGLVGTGGAGFPMHVKINAKADVVIANGAECEPLLETDRHFMLHHPEKVIAGVRYAMQASGAKRGIIGVKAKHQDIIALFTDLLKKERNIELCPLQNFYPAGDEHVLVYETTGRVVPAGGIPIEAGAIVNNVFTLGLLADAVEGRPFTKKYITVIGEVKTPCVGEVPLGISLREVIERLGGGITVADYGVIVGGPMMGKVCTNLDEPVTKTTGGIIVLPADHKLFDMKNSDI